MQVPRSDINFLKPVPSDGEISRSIEPIHIHDIAAHNGIEMYEI